MIEAQSNPTPFEAVPYCRWMHDAGDFAHELEIVWLEDPTRFEYVREAHVDGCATRAGRPWRPTNARELWPMVAYATVGPGAARGVGGYTRRYWFVKDYDRHAQPHGTYATTAPSEAVDPATIRAGRPSLLTQRAWRGSAAVA